MKYDIEYYRQQLRQAREDAHAMAAALRVWRYEHPETPEYGHEILARDAIERYSKDTPELHETHATV